MVYVYNTFSKVVYRNMASVPSFAPRFISYGAPASAPIVYPRPMTIAEIREAIDHGIMEESSEEEIIIANDDMDI